jgi:divalent metal cation (Fe/Co/Zn/Cd) transporter
MSLEAGVAIVAAFVAGSVALLAFGLDSLIELTSAGTILWLYTGSRHSSDAAERRAQQLIAACFALLALYVAFDAIDTLAGGSHPGTSWPGVAIAGLAVREGGEAWAGEVCGDCAPIGFEPRADGRGENCTA